MPRKILLEDRFWKKVDKKSKDECWNWLGSLNKMRGYGQIYSENYKIILAHRLSWIIHFGEIPIGKLVLHKCDNKKCVNPNHLYLGTHGDNAKDKVLRNPSVLGPTSKFYEGEAWLMKKLWQSKKFTQIQIAKMFKCSPRTIGHIVNGETANFKIMEVRECQI